MRSVNYEKLFAYLLAFGWLFGGLVYLYSASIASFYFEPNALTKAQDIILFFNKVRPAEFFYELIYSIFMIADFALLMLAYVLKNKFQDDTQRNQIVSLSFLAAAVLALLVNIIMFSCWHVIGTFSVNFSYEMLSNLWMIVLVLQYIAIWLTAWSFLLMGVGAFILYHIAKQQTQWHKGWLRMTLLLTLTLLIAFVAIVYGVIRDDSIPYAMMYLILTLIVMPIWSFWLGRQLST